MKMKLTTMALSALMAAGPAMADLVFPSLSIAQALTRLEAFRSRTAMRITSHC